MAVANMKCLVFIISNVYLRPRDVDVVVDPLLRVLLEGVLLRVVPEELLLLVALEELLLAELDVEALLRVVLPVLLAEPEEELLVAAGEVVVVEAPEELTRLLVTEELVDPLLLRVEDPEVVALLLVVEPEVVAPLRVVLPVLLAGLEDELLVELPEEVAAPRPVVVVPLLPVTLPPDAAPVPLPVVTDVAARLSLVRVVFVASLF